MPLSIRDNVIQTESLHHLLHKPTYPQRCEYVSADAPS